MSAWLFRLLYGPRFPPLCIPPPVPSSGIASSRAVTPLRLYYEPVRLPHGRFHSLSFSDCRRIPRLRGTLRASQVPVISLRSHTAALDPGREKHISPWRCPPCCLPASQSCRPLRQEHFGAQYLHLRCGLVTPFERLHHFPLPVMVRCWCQAIGSILPVPDFDRQEITSFLGALRPAPVSRSRGPRRLSQRFLICCTTLMTPPSPFALRCPSDIVAHAGC